VEFLDREWLEQFVNLHSARLLSVWCASRAQRARTASAGRTPSREHRWGEAKQRRGDAEPARADSARPRPPPALTYSTAPARTEGRWQVPARPDGAVTARSMVTGLVSHLTVTSIGTACGTGAGAAGRGQRKHQHGEGGYAVFLFALVGVYLYFGALSVATGGKPVPMGRPILYG
jgi:hypothetical protein